MMIKRIKKQLQNEINAYRFIRAQKDVVYFMETLDIYNPQHGNVIFKPTDKQKTWLEQIHGHKFIVDNVTTRQDGMSTLLAAYALHHMLFKPERTVLFGGYKHVHAKEMIYKMRGMYDSMIPYFKHNFLYDNKMSFQLDNGSRIHASSYQTDAFGRGINASLVILEDWDCYTALRKQTMLDQTFPCCMEHPFYLQNL